MKAQVLYGVNDLRFEENYRTPSLNENEALVKVMACGICGSDVNRVLKNGTYNFPTIIGHEFSGVVENVADKANEAWIGKAVSVFPLIPCKKCDSCMKGDYQLCEHYNYLGSRCDGGFAEYVAVPVWNLIKIPNGIPFEQAAMLEPASVALHALKISGNLVGKKIAVLGTGTISTIIAQILSISGCEEFCILGRNSEKLQFIKRIINSANVHDSNTDLSSYENYFDVVIEGTGASEMVGKSFHLCKRKGVVVAMGNPIGDINISQKDYWQIMRKELSVRGTWNSSYGISDRNDWKNIFSFLQNKKLDFSNLITHRLALKDLLNGILLMKNKTEMSNKVMVIYE